MFSYLSKKESLSVAGMTAALYAAVYFYERGAASELNIPLELITLSIPTISNDIMIIFFFSVPIVTISIVLLMWAKGNKKKKAAAHLGISGVYLAASYLMLNFPLKDLPFVGFFALLLLIPLSHWMPLDSEKEAISFEEGNIATFGVQIINIAATLFFFSFTFISLGRSSVHDNELTTFVKDNKEYAIVKVYDENVFTWSVVNGKIIRHLTYFRMENINGLEFNQKKFKSDIKNKE